MILLRNRGEKHLKFNKEGGEKGVRPFKNLIYSYLPLLSIISIFLLFKNYMEKLHPAYALAPRKRARPGRICPDSGHGRGSGCGHLVPFRAEPPERLLKNSLCPGAGHRR